MRCSNCFSAGVRYLILWHPRRSGDRVRRREFIGLIGGAALVWPSAARAQQSRKIVGVLQAQEPTSPPIPFIQAFLTRLRELGWVEGQTVHVEFRGAPTIERMTELAADFVRMKANVIYALSSAHVEAASRVTKTIPIVFSTHGDPVGAGHVRLRSHRVPGRAAAIRLDRRQQRRHRYALGRRRSRPFANTRRNC